VQSTRHSDNLVAVTLISLLLASSAVIVTAGPYDTFRQRSEIEAALAAAAQAHPELMTIIEVGTSVDGHPLLVARIAAAGTTVPDQRPAVFVGANIAGAHHSGSEAALHLIDTLLAQEQDEVSQLLAAVTFYIAPMLNPDAHDCLFASVRRRCNGNGELIDRDRDGLIAEDGHDDLDGDGRITSMRIPDPAGEWLPHPDEPRLMVKSDATKGWVGSYRLLSEGFDNDGDGDYNEDPAEGIILDRSFPHAFPYPDPGAGPWPGYTPEVKAIFDFLFAHRNVAVAVVYGPANNLLALPQELGSGGSSGDMKVKIPKRFAGMLGFDPEEEYTLDEIWEVAKESAFVRRANITKEQMAQFFGAGPATKLDEADLEVLKRLAKDYKERLEQAGLDKERPGTQYGAGGMTPWLYYQYGALALELDVWGIPKAKQEKKDGEQPLTLDRLEEISSEELLALDLEVIAAFLEEIGAPPQFSAERLVERVESGQVSPEQLAKMVRQMGGGSGKGGDKQEDDKETTRQIEMLAWLDQNQPDAFTDWTELTLPDGTTVEVGGRDPFGELLPAKELLAPALQVHTDTVLDLAGQLARLEVVSLELTELGGDVYRVEAVAANRGQLASHTKMAVRTRTQLPVRLLLETGDGVELVTGYNRVTAERLEGRTGTISGEWLIRTEPGATVTVKVSSDTGGSHQMSQAVVRGGAR
jgi:hypothetical protein